MARKGDEVLIEKGAVDGCMFSINPKQCAIRCFLLIGEFWLKCNKW